MTMAFLPLLQAASEHQHGFSGTVINMCSISGIVKTAQHHFAYNASKAAVIHLTKMLGFEIGNNGLKVRVNSIAPGMYSIASTRLNALVRHMIDQAYHFYHRRLPI